MANLPRDKDLPSTKPQHYRAPTWSWASIDAGIVHHHYEALELEVMITVQEASVQCLTDDPTGQVSGGHISLRGMVLNAEYRKGKRILWQIRAGTTEVLGHVYHDTQIEPGTDVSQWHQGHILLVAKTDWEPIISIEPRTVRSVFEGLLLEPVKATEALFERRGIYHISLDPNPTALQMFGLKIDNPGQLAEFINEDALQTIILV